MIKMKCTHTGPVTTCLILFSHITNERGVAFNIPVQIQNNRGTACLVLQIYQGTKCKTITIFLKGEAHRSITISIPNKLFVM